MKDETMFFNTIEYISAFQKSNNAYFELLSHVIKTHYNHSVDEQQKRSQEIANLTQDAISAFDIGKLPTTLQDYNQDRAERFILFMDCLRKRGDNFQSHEKEDCPSVLIYDYEIVVDGHNLERPSNYMLLSIIAPEDFITYDWKRPYIIIDPRAGHGAGIGGFKPDSQVGVALGDGHPVYFVAFRPQPEPKQTLADVAHCEAVFINEIKKRHPKSPNPIIIGNCQGGWATAILAATNPDITGPILLNGAPISCWSGRLGQDTMRYLGGMSAGALPALFTADLNGGLFDGANLVLNFESFNPARTWFDKYYNLFLNIDNEREHFLAFERWWGGFFLMRRDEIRWILENLFIGNKLSRNEARLETGHAIDLKEIKAPIIVFASHGDTITSPQQALNWIRDSYVDEKEIEIRGQRILYMIHEDVGHLGIFVSSCVARREHREMASTLKTIEALPPGLYEMKIEDSKGQRHKKTFSVSFHKRKIKDILPEDIFHHEEAFAAVSKLSEKLVDSYEATLAPTIKLLNPPEVAKIKQTMHPLRLQRNALSSNNIVMIAYEHLADEIDKNRHLIDITNPFVSFEKLFAKLITYQLDASRIARCFITELSFFMAFSHPVALSYGKSHAQQRFKHSIDDLRHLPNIENVLQKTHQGNKAEAIIRMLILLADTRKDVRKDRLDRAAILLETTSPFKELSANGRACIIHQQTLICHFEPQEALATLPKLLKEKIDRLDALEYISYVLGEFSDMSEPTRQMVENFKNVLETDFPPFSSLEKQSPLAVVA